MRTTARFRWAGAWVGAFFPLLAKLRGLPGSALDVFGHTDERRMERRLIVEYERVMALALDRLSPDNMAAATELALLPERMRGFGHVKERNVVEAKKREGELVAAMSARAAEAVPA